MFNPDMENAWVYIANWKQPTTRGWLYEQKCLGYRGYIFTGNPDLAKKIGLRAARKIEFYNGKLIAACSNMSFTKASKREPKE